jgi:hypothetical protein
VASFLEKQGFRAFALKGGYLAWLKAGYPIDSKVATRAMPLKMICPECGAPLESHASHES